MIGQQQEIKVMVKMLIKNNIDLYIFYISILNHPIDSTITYFV